MSLSFFCSRCQSCLYALAKCRVPICTPHTRLVPKVRNHPVLVFHVTHTGEAISATLEGGRGCAGVMCCISRTHWVQSLQTEEVKTHCTSEQKLGRSWTLTPLRIRWLCGMKDDMQFFLDSLKFTGCTTSKGKITRCLMMYLQNIHLCELIVLPNNK